MLHCRMSAPAPSSRRHKAPFPEQALNQMTIIRFIRSAMRMFGAAVSVVSDLRVNHLPSERELSRLGIKKADFEAIHLN